MRIKLAVSLAGAAATVALIAQGSSGASSAPAPPPLPSPSHFVSRITNRWFPLRPGTVLRYRGIKDGTPAVDVLTVTHLKRTLMGIHATVIHDRLYERGRLAERTTDWYAQDRAGNVWYLGERTATLGAHGKIISTEGTWMVGVHGALAGIYMPAHPKVGDSGYQELYKGHAEDRFRVLRLNARVSTPGGSSRHALLTKETTALEPGVVDHKLYIRGIGTAREETVKGGHEKLVLVSVKLP
jgi:hypothetical protein